MYELYVYQRDYNFKQQQYYSDPNTAMKEQYSRQDLNDLKKTIDDKTAIIAKDKQEISDLEDALRQAGGEPGWATPPAEAPPATATQ
jgi:parvulin-like peptidyl-prolyl isomerase